MNLAEIKAAVESGHTVYWKSRSYVVVKDNLDQWFVKYVYGDHYTGLTHDDGVTLSDDPADFFLMDEDEIVQDDALAAFLQRDGSEGMVIN